MIGRNYEAVGSGSPDEVGSGWARQRTRGVRSKARPRSHDRTRISVERLEAESGVEGDLERARRIVRACAAVNFHLERERIKVGKLLPKLGFSHMSARPRHPAQDERIVEAFKKTSRARKSNWPSSRGDPRRGWPGPTLREIWSR